MNIKPLIFDKDIKDLKKKDSLSSQELELVRHAGLNEHRVQSLAKNYFDSLNQEVELKGIGSVFFFQIDNGANNLTAGAKIRKWQEGTRPAMPDTGVLVWNNLKQYHRCWFIEFKRVESENYIKGNQKSKSGLKTYRHYQKQLAMHDKLRKMGAKVYLTNNIPYCREIIGQEIKEFINE